MPFLKSRSGHSKSTYGIYWYLTRSSHNKDRVLAADYINIAQGSPWFCQMDATRKAADNNRYKGGRGKARTYNHYIISPNPKDRIGLDGLRCLATAWAHEHFASYQIAIVYHDDNAGHIPHAHIVVNNTDLETGRRLQITKDMPERMKTRLQEMGRDMGLRYFDNERDDKLSSLHLASVPQDAMGFAPVELASAEAARGHAHSPRSLQGVYKTYAERHADGRGRLLWKEDIRARADIALHASATVAQYKEYCAYLGLALDKTKDGAELLYIHPENPNWRCRASSLGHRYTERGAAEALVQAARSGAAAGLADPVRFKAYMDGFRQSAKAPIAYVRPGSGITLRDVADTFSLLKACGADTPESLSALEARFGKHPGAAKALAKARAIAQASGMLKEHGTPAPAPPRPVGTAGMTDAGLAKLIEAAYKEAGFGSGSEGRAKGTDSRARQGAQRPKKTAPKSRRHDRKEQ